MSGVTSHGNARPRATVPSPVSIRPGYTNPRPTAAAVAASGGRMSAVPDHPVSQWFTREGGCRGTDRLFRRGSCGLGGRVPRHPIPGVAVVPVDEVRVSAGTYRWFTPRFLRFGGRVSAPNARVRVVLAMRSGVPAPRLFLGFTRPGGRVSAATDSPVSAVVPAQAVDVRRTNLLVPGVMRGDADRSPLS